MEKETRSTKRATRSQNATGALLLLPACMLAASV